VGFPGETREDIRGTYHRVAQCDPDLANFHPLQVRPASGYWRLLRERGVVGEDFFTRLAHTGHGEVLGNNQGITSAELARYAVQLTLRYNLSPRRGLRAARILRGPVMRHAVRHGVALFVLKRLADGGLFRRGEQPYT
jgi:hypothetical protein